MTNATVSQAEIEALRPLIQALELARETKSHLTVSQLMTLLVIASNEEALSSGRLAFSDLGGQLRCSVGMMATHHLQGSSLQT
jgi:hypothetical protein